jgi:hypothetical protein
MAAGSVGTARAARSMPSSWATRAGYAAFAWALLFAAAHVYWAFGGTALLAEAPDLSAGVCSPEIRGLTSLVGRS